MADDQLSPDDLKDLIRRVFRQVPFSRVLGLEVGRLRPDGVTVELEMRKEFVGNHVRGTLHGGVISAALDTAGGLAAYTEPLLAHPRLSRSSALERFERLGTIDLRVDYLQPGKGTRFTASARLLRRGRRVAVTRMELHNEEGELIAVGTGSYVVG